MRQIEYPLKINFPLNCQVNGYVKVTGISGTAFNISSVNQTDDAFEVGGKTILIQMQDNVPGSTIGDASFEDIGSISSTGQYEIVTIIM